MTPLYNTWFDMYQRCSSDRSKALRPHYKDVNLYEGWLVFEVFAEWAQKQTGYGVVGFDGHLFQLDKDLLGDGKTYSPEYCCFLPKEVNMFLRKNISVKNTTGFTGVSSLPNGKYRACVRDPRIGRNIHLGCFADPEKAHSAYLGAKSEIGGYLSCKYKDLISEAAYLALKTL
jgi:hypothetical protein